MAPEPTPPEHDAEPRSAGDAGRTPAQAADEQWNVAEAQDAAAAGPFAGHADGAEPAQAEPARDAAPAEAGALFDWRWLAPLALVVLVFLAFSPALDADWVNWDDDRNFTGNLDYRGLGPDQLKWMFTTFHMAHWHPVTWLTLGLDYELWDMDAAGYHRTNLVIHAAAAVAAFFFARRLFARVAPQASELAQYLAAFFAVALFAVHPLRVESVAWVTERRDVLSGLFFFLALGAWMRYVDAADDSRARRRAWSWSLVWFVLAGMSKVAVFPLPLVLVVLDFWPLKRAQFLGFGRLVKEKLAHAGVMVALMFVAALGQGSANSMYSLEAHPLPPRLVHMGFTFFFYPAKTLLPRSLLPMYEMPPDAAFFTPPYLYPAIIGAALMLVMLFLWRPAVSLAVTWAVFLLFILPTSGLTQAGSQIAADRYSYLSCLSFAFLAGGLLFLLVRGRAGLWIGAAVGSVLVGACVLLTHAQCGVWKDTRTFWEYVHAVQPDNTFALDSLGHIKIGDAKVEQDPEKKKQLILDAIALHDKAFQLKGDARHLLNVAEAIHEMAFADEEHFDEHVKRAFETCEQGFKLADEQGVMYRLPWYRTRGSLYMDLGRFEEAARDLEQYTQDRTNQLDLEAFVFLGMTYVELKKPKEAEATLAYVVKQNPAEVRAWAALGQLYMSNGFLEPAKSALNKVLELQAAAGGADPSANALAGQAREWLQAIQAHEAKRAGAAPNSNAPAPGAAPSKPGG